MQFSDEYERATTAQVGTINADGTNLQLGPRNVSHRVSPALLPDGHVLYTEWMHMGEVNEGHLRMVNTDMTGMREAFGDELGGRQRVDQQLPQGAATSRRRPYQDPARGQRPMPDTTSSSRSPPRATARCSRASSCSST